MEIPKRRRGGLRRGRVAVVGAIAASAVLAFGVSSAQAASPFNAAFDDAALNVGVVFDILDPPNTATLSSADWDKGATNDFTGGTLSFPDFTGDALPGVPVTVKFSALDPITGNLNPSTGVLTTDPSTYRAVVSLASATCTYDVDMAFTTASGTPFNGDPFTVVPGSPDSLTNGVIQTGWSGLPAANPAVGDCSLINNLVAGPGGLAMGNGIDITPQAATAPAAPAPAPVKKKKCKKGFKLKKVHGKKKCVKKKKK
jgi:hypothetical protein